MNSQFRKYDQRLDVAQKMFQLAKDYQCLNTKIVNKGKGSYMQIRMTVTPHEINEINKSAKLW